MRFGTRLRGPLAVSAWLGGGSGRIKSIQRGTVTIGSGATSNTAAITGVDVNNARLVLLGINCTAETLANNATCRIALTSATQVTATVNATGTGNRIVSFEVVEYFPGAIRSIQRDTATGATKTITAVDTNRSTVDFLGYTTNAGGPDTGEAFCSVILTNATTVTVGGASGTFVTGFQVIEWH